MKLSIVVPCYNEAGNIPLIIERFSEVIKRNDQVEILLVDNGSTDDSQKIMKTEIEKSGYSHFQIVHVKNNLGYGFGILEGLKSASGDILSWTHADMQTDPCDLITAFDLYQSSENKEIIVKGKRKNRPFLDAFFTWGMQMISSFYLGVYLDDINAQPKLFSRRFFEEKILNKAPYDFSLDLFLLYCAKSNQFQLKEIPVYFAKRIHGEAKGGGSFKTKFKLIKRTMAYIRELSLKVKTGEYSH